MSLLLDMFCLEVKKQLFPIKKNPLVLSLVCLFPNLKQTYKR